LIYLFISAKRVDFYSKKRDEQILFESIRNKQRNGNKNYMSIAVSVLTTSSIARNSGSAVRQENRPQSELHIVPSVSIQGRKNSNGIETLTITDK